MRAKVSLHRHASSMTLRGDFLAGACLEGRAFAHARMGWRRWRVVRWGGVGGEKARKEGWAGKPPAQGLVHQPWRRRSARAIAARRPSVRTSAGPGVSLPVDSRPVPSPVPPVPVPPVPPPASVAHAAGGRGDGVHVTRAARAAVPPAPLPPPAPPCASAAPTKTRDQATPEEESCDDAHRVDHAAGGVWGLQQGEQGRGRGRAAEGIFPSPAVDDLASGSARGAVRGGAGARGEEAGGVPRGRWGGHAGAWGAGKEGCAGRPGQRGLGPRGRAVTCWTAA